MEPKKKYGMGRADVGDDGVEILIMVASYIPTKSNK